ncbi:hypothetical protein K493DRAFT_351443 [Basidiobolus meristosporus CBS 931.73]|uniref:Uncharacterized protein n=1 Tax=Basidiobolus meristosporus CBS 931.73 TaxID=1314790 RepID=A0A1Y1YC04_9FUNG|nr:hypothetical protein K493DRAFT_351443 [Basidiobolus meristosporus CBS 931.73]|eukprot:ORX95571.1 hypothetical protein K493DRAFT_351443 [Basidiobolus meristosporus CBS 931.73]
MDKVHANLPDYVRIINQLSILANAKNIYHAETVHIENLKTAIEQRKQNIARLQKISKKELKDVQKLERFSLSKLKAKLKGDLEQRKAKEQREFLAALENENSEKAALEGLEIQLNESTAKWHQAASDSKRHETLEKELANLYSKTFDGPTPDFPKEDVYESQLNQALQTYNQVSSELNVMSQVKVHIYRAEENLRGALVRMQSALSSATFDMFTHSSFIDAVKYSDLGAARNLAASAQAHIDQARRLLPTIPHIGSLDVTQGSMLVDVFFDNLLTDMLVRNQIQESYSSLCVSHSNLQSIQQWIIQMTGNLERAHQEVSSELKLKRRNLNEERHNIFESIMRQQLNTTIPHEAASFGHENPPPAYDGHL